MFRVPGRVSVAAGEGAKSFRIATATIAPELMVHSVPALDETAFLLASFKQTEDAPLLPGRVSIYRDGIFVGRSPMALIAKDCGRRGSARHRREGQDRPHHRAPRRGHRRPDRLVEKTDEREFKTTIRSGHAVPIRFAIEDQIPVSEAEDIPVETLPMTTPPTARDLRDRRGVLEWAFDVQPGENREIKLGWRVRWPKDKTVQFSPQVP